MATSTEAIWGIRAVNRCSPEHYIDWAMGMLEAGKDTKHLRILAGLATSESWFFVEECFDKASHELGLLRPSHDEAIKRYSVWIAGQMIAEKISSREGVKRLAQLCASSNYSNYLMIWFKLDDALAAIYYNDEPWTYRGLTKQNAVETIRKEATDFIQQHSN